MLLLFETSLADLPGMQFETDFECKITAGKGVKPREKLAYIFFQISG